jgi:hypothetical protein
VWQHYGLCHFYIQKYLKKAKEEELWKTQIFISPCTKKYHLQNPPPKKNKKIK